MRKLIIATLVMTSFSHASACDMCGRGDGNLNPLLFPHLSKNYLGLSWVQSKYNTSAQDGSKVNVLSNSLVLSAQYSPLKKLQIAVIAPWQSTNMQNLDGKTKLAGIGDIIFLANYRLFDKQNSGIRQTIIVGGGTKIPSGKYTAAKPGEEETQNFQVGSGSMDYLIKASWHLGWRQWTLSVANSYKYNTRNADHYRYGDVLVNSLTALYQKQIKNFSVSPYVQLVNETHMRDAEAHVLQRYSGGHLMYLGGGLDLSVKKVSGGLNCQVIPHQAMAQGSIIVKPQLSAHLLINL